MKKVYKKIQLDKDDVDYFESEIDQLMAWKNKALKLAGHKVESATLEVLYIEDRE